MSQPAETLDPSLPKPGELILSKYRIERILGQGGMGIVYKANHEILGVPVAIKLLLADIATSQEAVTRFMNEARRAMEIQSENVAKVSDAGHLDNGRPYMVIEFLEGDDLSKLLEKRGVLSVHEAIDYTLQALEALAQAHSINIVHRDLKPANLFLVQRRDKTMQVKVLDFGISKASNPLDQGSGAMTSTKALLGSPYYMSPEQLRSSKSVDARADIWSMGIILFELMTGQPPFLGDNFGELFAAILEMDPPSLRTKRPDIPPQLEHVVMRCLQRKPDQRYSNVGELAAALGPFASSRGQRTVQRILDVMPIDGKPASMAPAPPGYGPPAQSGATFAYHPPMPGASTGSGVFTAPGVAPQGVQTNSSWTGAQVQPRAPSNSAAIVFGLFFGVLVLSLSGFFGWRAWQGHRLAAAAGSSALSATAPTPVPVIPDTATMPTVAATTTATPPAADTASAKPADPTTAQNTHSTTSTHHTTTTATTPSATAATTASHSTTTTTTTATHAAPTASHGGAFDPMTGGAH